MVGPKGGGSAKAVSHPGGLCPARGPVGYLEATGSLARPPFRDIKRDVKPQVANPFVTRSVAHLTRRGPGVPLASRQIWAWVVISSRRAGLSLPHRVVGVKQALPLD